MGKSPGDSHWLSPEPLLTSDGKEGEIRVKIENKTNSENYPSHIELGLKKPMSEYTLEDIPQLCEEIAELFSDLLGALCKIYIIYLKYTLDIHIYAFLELCHNYNSCDS